MRIVGGRFRGRRLAVPKDQKIRPTTDRTRESLFNILSHNWPNQLQGNVLDVFAGTGAIGLEALSRGASSVTFLEKSRAGAELIRQNIRELSVEDEAHLIVCDATKPIPSRKSTGFDLIFADPPYGKGLGERALVALGNSGWINTNALVILEEKRGQSIDQMPDFEPKNERDFGETTIKFYLYGKA